jgi:hypothetical protein
VTAAEGARAEALLAALGLGHGAETAEPEVSAECIRIARRLRINGERVVGLIPLTAKVAVPPVAVRMGVALVKLTGATVAYVDANVRWPALSAISSRPSTDSEDSVYATRWLSDSLALLTPPATESAGQVVPQLRRVLVESQSLFQFVLVDLTGFHLLGEHAAAAQLVDGVIAVGRAGKTRESDLLRAREELARSQFLGVLLVG